MVLVEVRHFVNVKLAECSDRKIYDAIVGILNVAEDGLFFDHFEVGNIVPKPETIAIRISGVSAMSKGIYKTIAEKVAESVSGIFPKVKVACHVVKVNPEDGFHVALKT